MYLFPRSLEFTDPFYQIPVRLFPWEWDLLQSEPMRRLKLLSHYGTGSLLTAAKHSRFEHTVGVWTILATFFPDDAELRIAALLHDIGHLPFSHAVERTLGFNHHHLTEERIRHGEVAGVLKANGFEPERIIALLNQDSPLTHRTPYLSADHLDSFLRDAYMHGYAGVQPASVLRSIRFNGHYVEAGLPVAQGILGAIHCDHGCFLHPLLLALDALLSKAVALYARDREVELDYIAPLTNQGLLQLLLDSGIREVRELLDVVMLHPEKVATYEEAAEGADEVRVTKLYDRTPLVDGVPLTDLCPDSRALMDRIRAMKRSYWYQVV